jgi:uncharacterized integral membrane protein
VRGTLFWLLLWLVAVTVFAWSNQATIVTVRFWQWPVAEGPLGMVVIGAGVLGALLTYVSSLAHHVRQAQHIRSLEESIRAHETRPVPPLPAGGPAGRPIAPGPAEETRPRLS